MAKSRTERAASDWAQAGSALAAWYQKSRRDLPWRRTRDPYAVLVSEIMLQQTQVKTVCGRYEQFMDRFPDVQSLADASEEELLKAWEGLGYYTRARNLHRAAQCIVAHHGGRIPSTPEELLALPGIGAYTAGAVGAICFGLETVAVDANAERIAARLADLRQQVRSGSGRKQVEAVLTAMCRGTEPPLFVQAVMELGQTVCLPRMPECGTCPLQEWCLGKDAPSECPARKKPAPRPRRRWTVLVLMRDGAIALRRRAPSGLLAGMYAPPSIAGTLSRSEAAQAAEQMNLRIRGMKKLPGWRHEFTHQIWDLSAWLIRVEGTADDPALIWADHDAVEKNIAIPAAFRPAVQEWEKTAWTEL